MSTTELMQAILIDMLRIETLLLRNKFHGVGEVKRNPPL